MMGHLHYPFVKSRELRDRGGRLPFPVWCVQGWGRVMRALENVVDGAERWRWSSRLLGNADGTHLGDRVFRAVCLIGFLTGVLTGLLNYVSGNPAREMLFSVLATGVAGGAYVLSVRYQGVCLLKIPLVAALLGLLCAAWFTNQGSEGATLFYLFLWFVAVIIILSKPWNFLLCGIGAAAVAGLLLVEWRVPGAIISYQTPVHRGIDVAFSLLLCLGSVTALVYLVVAEHRKEHARNEQLCRQLAQDKADLEQAVRENRALKGLLPICATCKKIRDDGGHWHRLETYITRHAEVKFSHGICPDCERTYYADYDIK